jgi:hypothetical protein
MNKRIRQLWEDNDTIEVCYPEQGSPVSVSAKTLETFAQLIVKECIAQCEKNKDHEWLGSGSKMSAFNIKERFGVEE